MTMEDKINLLILDSILLNDTSYCRELSPETLGKLIVKRRALLDEFVKHGLPNSNNGPLRD